MVGHRKCLIFKQMNGWLDVLVLNKTSITLSNITLPCIFQNRVCVFFSMDKWIFGCLTTYAYDLGGTQEVSNFWADERMIWYSAIILTSITLPFATLPLLPYIQGVQTLSAKSNFAAILRKIGQKSKVRIFSWSQMRSNLFWIIIRGPS